MKNRFLNFLKNYWFCIFLSIIMVIGMFLSTVYANLYETGSSGSVIRLNLRDLYLVFGLPVYSLIYGFLSYIKTKRIWIPQFILCVSSFLYGFIYWWLIFDINVLVIVALAGTFIWSVCLVIFSLIGASITAIIDYIIKSAKENQN